ncbi:MAG: CDP-diacylglycerol--glycerol-3-phosphate 3-phosphatidyltransferase [Proteobacteria bacterium]|nr:CDP-diacylglycerol--glycerol-3-phosphate 3-phosphatidyltransferase [Pseudomonadota bacterium]
MTTLPNLLTLSRIGVTPILLALLYFHSPVTRWVALVLFAGAGLTDFLDGYLARHRGEVSAFGRILDPIADKLLVSSVIVILVAIEQIQGLVVVPAIVILCREILVSGLREYLAEVQVPMPVSKLAKWKTTLQMVALGFLVLVGAAAFLPQITKDTTSDSFIPKDHPALALKQQVEDLFGVSEPIVISVIRDEPGSSACHVEVDPRSDAGSPATAPG